MQSAKEVVSIFAVCFNTNSVRLCESLDPNVVGNNRTSGYLIPTTWRYDCEIADFMVPLFERIDQKRPTIVVFSFQEDVRPGSYVHSHLLPELMPKHGYKIFERTTLMGVGRTSYTGLKEYDPFVRGLRTSVYIQESNFNSFNLVFKSLEYTNSIFQNKGASAIYITLPNQEFLAIINCHFPFEPYSLMKAVSEKDTLIRDNAVYQQDIFFNEMYRKLVIDCDAKPNYVLLMGDLNYRIQPFENWAADKSAEKLLAALDNPVLYSQLIHQYDEYSLQSEKGNIYKFNEGVNNVGPQFAPTCKMTKQRSSELSIDSYRLGRENHRVPSHCDRILYKTVESRKVDLICTEYDRLEYGITNKSDHTPVIGTFTFALKQQPQ